MKKKLKKGKRKGSVCVCVCVCVCVLVAQLYLTICNPIDCSPPATTAHGRLQARTLEWVAIFFSKRNYRKKENEVAQSPNNEFLKYFEISLFQMYHDFRWMITLFLPFAGEEQVVPAGFLGYSAEIDEYFLQNRGPQHCL